MFFIETIGMLKEGCSVSFAFSQKKILADGQVNETVATVEELNVCGKTGAMDMVLRFVMNYVFS